MYAYANSRPVLATDPLGLSPWDDEDASLDEPLEPPAPPRKCGAPWIKEFLNPNEGTRRYLEGLKGDTEKKGGTCDLRLNGRMLTLTCCHGFDCDVDPCYGPGKCKLKEKDKAFICKCVADPI